MDLYLEIIAVIFGLVYLIFLIKEQIICWLFGIIGSLLSIFLFYRTQLYSEAILYCYYVVIGIYGWVHWQKSTQNEQIFKVTDLSATKYLYIIFIGEILALSLGYFFENYTDASAPYLDTHTTVFSFIASYMEVKKWLASWKFWIIINGATIILYFGKDLNWYSALTVIYLVFSFVGYFRWKRLSESFLIIN
ncbi:nicotinamide riboside transporter PnuC [Seonamhaeicola sp. MEBiC1930]|uniref:nicotinamide riboside transporter PnuC n=1 Tax=Seonamhaeicola sp. MEBiC01930 TaxID=2976768 RepID=UPI00324CE752